MEKHEMNCPNCKHYIRPKMNVYTPDEPRKCAIGLDSQMNNWWADNGHLPAKSVSSMPCFEPNETFAFLDDMLAKADEILEALKNENQETA